jgi:hypothetical protein
VMAAVRPVLAQVCLSQPDSPLLAFLARSGASASVSTLAIQPNLFHHIESATPSTDSDLDRAKMLTDSLT